MPDKSRLSSITKGWDKMKRIEIWDRDGHWAGSGTLDEFGHIECSAVLYPDSEDEYGQIELAFEDGVSDGTTSHGYIWQIFEQ